MKNMNNNEFNIQRTTMRDLTSDEVNHVAGGTGVTIDLTIVVTRVIITTIGISTSIFTTTQPDEEP